MTTELLSIRALIDIARLRPAQALATETHQSFPVPVDAGGPAVAFLYATSRLDANEGLRLLAPSYRATILADSGHFRELCSVTSADFGLADEASNRPGVFALPPDVTAQDYTLLKEQLLTAYDVVMPWFFDGVVAPSPAVAQAVRDFRSRFELVSEGFLRPYYRAIGRKFFTWLDTVAT